MQNLAQNTNIKMIFPATMLIASLVATSEANMSKMEVIQNNTSKFLDMSSLNQVNNIDSLLFRSMLNFAENIVKNSHDLDADFAKIINDNIIDLLA
ncbi:MAG: hypothetical protein ACTTJC_02075 [Campylobacter sp.]